MPPKKNAVDELKSSEIRKLIKAHNKLMSLDIPKGTDREGLIPRRRRCYEEKTKSCKYAKRKN